MFFISEILGLFAVPALAKNLQGKENTSQIPITQIQIVSPNKKVDLSFLHKKYKNKAFSQKISQEIYASLLSTLKRQKILLPQITGPLFSFTPKGFNISYQIKNPYRYGFVLKGNKSFSSKQVLSSKVYKKYFNNPQLIQKTLAHIKESYLKKGYSHVRLSHYISTDEKHFIKTVFISIEEGYRVRIGNFRIFGQFSQPAKYYIRLLRSLSGPLVQKRFFYGPDIQQGLKNLTYTLQNKGYLVARARARITKSSSHKVLVDLILKEGPLTTVKAIRFKGNKHFSHQQLQKQMRIKVTSGLNFLWLDKDIQTLIDLYKEAGFLDMDITNQKKIIHYDKEENTAVLHFDILEKKRVRINTIKVENQGKTKESFIKKKLNLKKGEILTTKKAQRALSRLNSLGVFSHVNISRQPREGALKGESDLLVQMEERKPRSFRFGLGLNTTRTLTARSFGEFSHINISGQGRRFFSRLNLQSNIVEYLKSRPTQPKHIERQAVLSYTEPFLFHSPFQGQLNVSNSSSIFSKKEGVIDIVDSTRAYFLLKISPFHFLDLSIDPLNWEGREEFKKTFLCEESPSDPSCDKSRLHILSSKLSLSIDQRDSLLFSSKGFLSQIFFEYAWPFSSKNIQFLKMELKHFDFRPLSHKWVWFNSLQGGVITNLHRHEAGGGVPVSRSFILGGVSSLRGFDGLIQGERVPNKEEFPIEHANALLSNRSSFYLLVKTELRFSFNKNMTGALFYDGGLVTVSGKTFQKPYRHSAGLGFRYKTPLGPVAGYLAFKISPQANEAPLVPHLSFGSF